MHLSTAFWTLFWTCVGLKQGIPADLMWDKIQTSQALTNYYIYTKVLPRVAQR